MPDKDQRKYQAAYYRKNKARLKKERAARYKNDPEYRAEHETRSKRYYWLKRRPARMRAKGKVGAATALPRPVALVTVRLPGGTEVETKVYTTTALIAVLRRTRQTLYQWEAAEVIPPPAMRKRDLDVSVIRGKNPRLYTEAELAILRDCAPLLQQPRKTMPQSVFATEVTKRFATLYRGVERHA